MKEEIYESTLKGKVKFYAYVFLFLCFGLLLKSGYITQLFYIDISNYPDNELNSYIIDNNKRVIIFNVIILPFYLAMAYTVFIFGRRINKSKQFPPPGSNMPFSLKIIRGDRAIRQAYSAYIGAVMIMLSWLVIFAINIYMSMELEELVAAIQ